MCLFLMSPILASPFVSDIFYYKNRFAVLVSPDGAGHSTGWLCYQSAMTMLALWWLCYHLAIAMVVLRVGYSYSTSWLWLWLCYKLAVVTLSVVVLPVSYSYVGCHCVAIWL